MEERKWFSKNRKWCDVFIITKQERGFGKRFGKEKFFAVDERVSGWVNEWVTKLVSGRLNYWVGGCLGKRAIKWVSEGGRGRWNRGEKNGISEEGGGVSKKTQSPTWIAVVVNIQITSKWISESLCTRGELRSFDYLNVEKKKNYQEHKCEERYLVVLKLETGMWRWQTNRDKRIQRTGKYFFLIVTF